MRGTWLPVLLLVQPFLVITSSAQSTTTTESQLDICVVANYTGRKDVTINEEQCGENDEIFVTEVVNVDGYDSTDVVDVGGVPCNVNVTHISKNLVTSGSITVRNAHCGDIFIKVRHIKSYDIFAIKFDNATLGVNSFAALRRIELVHVLDYCHLTKSDMFPSVDIPRALKSKFQKLFDLALKPCAIRNLIPTTTKTPVFSSERYLELSLYLFKLSVHNLEDVLSYLWKTSACWIPCIIAFVWYREHVLDRQHCEGLHMRERGMFRVYMDVIRELLPHSPLAIEISIKFMRFFDKTSIYYYLMTHTILEDLLETTDDANWCEANALRKQLKEIGVPVLLEIDERNKKLAAAGLITAPFTLYSKAERRKLAPQTQCVIEVEDDAPKPHEAKLWNVFSWFKDRYVDMVRSDGTHVPAHHFVAMEQHPIAKKMAERFLGDAVLQIANADLAMKLANYLKNSLKMQRKLEEIAHNTLNLYRMMEDKARDDEYEYAFFQRSRNRKFLLLQHYEDVMMVKGAQVPDEVDAPKPLEYLRFKVFSESMTISQNMVYIKECLSTCIRRSEENFRMYWRHKQHEILLQPVENDLFVSLTASARIRTIIDNNRKSYEKKVKKQLLSAKQKKAIRDAEWTKAKEEVIEELKRTGQLKGAFAATMNLRNPEQINIVPLKLPVPFVEVQEAVHIVQTERRIRKTGVSESDLPPKPEDAAPAPVVKRGFLGFLFKKKTKPQDIEAQPVDDNKKTDDDKKAEDPKNPADPKTSEDQKKPEVVKATGDVKKTDGKQATEGIKKDEKTAQVDKQKPEAAKTNVVAPKAETPKPEAKKPEESKTAPQAPAAKKTKEKTDVKVEGQGRQRTMSGPASLWPAIETTRAAYYHALPVLDGIRRERRLPEPDVSPYNNRADRGIRVRKQKKKKEDGEQ